MYGKYELTGDVYECKECPKYAVKDLKLNLSEDDGSLKVNLKSKLEIRLRILKLKMRIC